MTKERATRKRPANGRFVARLRETETPESSGMIATAPATKRKSTTVKGQ